ncbi:hypothetical protein ACWDG1_21830 [Streptomyces sp. NPDC001177]
MSTLIDKAIQAVIERVIWELGKMGFQAARELVEKWVKEHPDELKRISVAGANARAALAELIREIIFAIVGSRPDDQRWSAVPDDA